MCSFHTRTPNPVELQVGKTQVMEIGHDAVDKPQLARSMREKLEAVDRRLRQQWHRPTIHRVITSLRQGHSSAYDPKLVSIGPFHKDKAGLRAMEEHKWRYLNHLLDRSPVDHLDKCIEGVSVRLEEIRGKYSERLEEVTDEDLVTMMVVDGCFIIEFFVKECHKDVDVTLMSASMWERPLLLNDLLLLENQVPYFVLETLLEAIEPRPFSFTLAQMAIFSFSGGKSYTLPMESNLPIEFLHLLHFYHALCVSQPPREPPASSSGELICLRLRKMRRRVWDATRSLAFGWILCGGLPAGEPGTEERLLSLFIPRATKLKEAGVRLKRSEDDAILLDLPKQVRFANGVLEIPSLELNDKSWSLLRNLTTFEQCFPEYGTGFISYSFLMMQVMRTDSDVELLQECGIVVNLLASITEALPFFYNVKKGTWFTRKPFLYAEMVKDLNKYCKSGHLIR